MAEVKISQLVLFTPELTDEVIVNDVSAVVTKRATLESIRDLANQNIDDTLTGSEVTGDLNVTGDITGDNIEATGNLTFGGSLIDPLGNTLEDLETLVTEEELAAFINTSSSLLCLFDSTNSGTCGVRILGETTVDSDLIVKGDIYANNDLYVSGTGYGVYQFAYGADSANHAYLAERANFALTADLANRADSATEAKRSIVSVLQQVVQNNDDATYYPLFGPSLTGGDSVWTDPALNYNPQDNKLVAGFFEGDGSLLSNITATQNVISTTQAINNQGYYVVFTPTTNGQDSANTDANLLYQPITNTLYDPGGQLYVDALVRTAEKSTNTTASGIVNVLLSAADAGDSAEFAVNNLVTVDASNGTLNAAFFDGDGSAVTNVDAVTADVATDVQVTTTTDNAQFYMHFGSAVGGQDGVNAVGGLRANPSEPAFHIASDTGRMTLGEDSDAKVYHDGTNAYIEVVNGGLYVNSTVGTSVIVFDNLPTSSGGLVTGQLWNNSGVLSIA